MTLDYFNGSTNQAQALGNSDSLGLGESGVFKRMHKPAPNEQANQPTTISMPQNAEDVNRINRFNPAAILLRTGILLGMKLDTFNLGSQLRLAYLTDEEANSRNLNMARLAHLRKVQAKLEHVVFLGGGKPRNLKKAILEGKGNHEKSVPINGIGLPSIASLAFGSNSHVSEILGPTIYFGEVATAINGNNGLGSLVEVTTAAAIAAATDLLGAIAAVVQSVGDVTRGGVPGEADADGETAIAVPESAVPANEKQSEEVPAPMVDCTPAPLMEPQQVPDVTTDSARLVVEPIDRDASSPSFDQTDSETGPNVGIVEVEIDDSPLIFRLNTEAAPKLGNAVSNTMYKPPMPGNAAKGKGGSVYSYRVKPPQKERSKGRRRAIACRPYIRPRLMPNQARGATASTPVHSRLDASMMNIDHSEFKVSSGSYFVPIHENPGFHEKIGIPDSFSCCELNRLRPPNQCRDQPVP